MAGAKTPQQQTVATLENAIREAGRDPDAARQLLPITSAPIATAGNRDWRARRA